MKMKAAQFIKYFGAFCLGASIFLFSFHMAMKKVGDWDTKLVELFGKESISVLAHANEATVYVLDPLKATKSQDKMLDGTIKIRYAEKIDSLQLNYLLAVLNDTTLYNYKPYLSRTPFAPEIGIQFKDSHGVLTLYYMHDAREITLYHNHESSKYILLKDKNDCLKETLQSILSERFLRKVHWKE